jgi:cytochrome c oxidase cbb3-type subunit 3
MSDQKNEPTQDGDDHLLDHQYDGIQEFDNPMPRWWVWMYFLVLPRLCLPLLGRKRRLRGG